MPLRRSARLAAKKADADAMKVGGENQAKKDTATKSKAKPSRRRSRSRSPSKSCSLQSLDKTPRQSQRIKAQKKEKALNKAPKKSKTGRKKSKLNARPPLSPITNASCDNIQRVAKSPAAKPKRNVVPAVTPHRTTPKPKGVKFNLNRNSFAEYKKENPPNIVEHLISEADEYETFQEAGVIDDETRLNEEILGEWESSFDDLCDGGSQRSNRRRARRVSMLPN